MLTDDTEVRAITAAHWLVQMGWDVSVLEGGIGAAGTETGMPPRRILGHEDSPVGTVTPQALSDILAQGEAVAVDVDHSMDYRKNHLPGALWAIRPRLNALLAEVARQPMPWKTGRRLRSALGCGHRSPVALPIPISFVTRLPDCSG